MPLAAMVPLGIITAAIGLAGLGMGGVHYLFQGEVRDRFQGPGPVCPRCANKRHNTPRAPRPPLLSCARQLATAAPAAALPLSSQQANTQLGMLPLPLPPV